MPGLERLQPRKGDVRRIPAQQEVDDTNQGVHKRGIRIQMPHRRAEQDGIVQHDGGIDKRSPTARAQPQQAACLSCRYRQAAAARRPRTGTARGFSIPARTRRSASAPYKTAALPPCARPKSAADGGVDQDHPHRTVDQECGAGQNAESRNASPNTAQSGQHKLISGLPSACTLPCFKILNQALSCRSEEPLKSPAVHSASKVPSDTAARPVPTGSQALSVLIYPFGRVPSSAATSCRPADTQGLPC